MSKDLFNEVFSGTGWIVHDSMESALVNGSIALVQKGNFSQAQEHLIQYHFEKDLQWYVSKCETHSPIMKSHAAIELAFQFYREQHYGNCSAILRAVLDSIVFDLEKRHHPLFTVETAVDHWTKLSSNNPELRDLQTIYEATRRKGDWNYTEIMGDDGEVIPPDADAEINIVYLPYSHGILYASYDHLRYEEITSAKGWSALLVYSDYLSKWKH